jgi:hypothetical protein
MIVVTAKIFWGKYLMQDVNYIWVSLSIQKVFREKEMNENEINITLKVR